MLHRNSEHPAHISSITTYHSAIKHSRCVPTAVQLSAVGLPSQLLPRISRGLRAYVRASRQLHPLQMNTWDLSLISSPVAT